MPDKLVLFRRTIKTCIRLKISWVLRVNLTKLDNILKHYIFILNNTYKYFLNASFGKKN